MITVRPGAERGHLDHGWLDTYHTFSFGDYYDPKHVRFRSLRVMNEDRVGPGTGFGMHPHRDMEIVTYVLDGRLEHRDDQGGSGVIGPGELQRMTAGTGIRHSEKNASNTDPVHLYQIWLLPERPGLSPGYDQRRFDPAGRRGAWQPVAAPDGRDGALAIRQDAVISLADLADGGRLSYDLAAGRHAWLQILRGTVTLGGHALAAGDGAALSDESRLDLAADGGPAEVMLFDLA